MEDFLPQTKPPPYIANPLCPLLGWHQWENTNVYPVALIDNPGQIPYKEIVDLCKNDLHVSEMFTEFLMGRLVLLVSQDGIEHISELFTSLMKYGIVLCMNDGTMLKFNPSHNMYSRSTYPLCMARSLGLIIREMARFHGSIPPDKMSSVYCPVLHDWRFWVPAIFDLEVKRVMSQIGTKVPDPTKTRSGCVMCFQDPACLVKRQCGHAVCCETCVLEMDPAKMQPECILCRARN